MVVVVGAGDEHECRENKSGSRLLSPGHTSDDVVEAVLAGFQKGEQEYGVTARVILCCIR